MDRAIGTCCLACCGLFLEGLTFNFESACLLAMAYAGTSSFSFVCHYAYNMANYDLVEHENCSTLSQVYLVCMH